MQLKDLSEWDEDYILSLPTDEFDWLEFKRSEKLTGCDKQDLSKYVSAWANYEGGYLIFGVENQNGVLKIDGGVPENLRRKLDDWLDQFFPSLVDPTLPKISTRLIRPKADGSQIPVGNCVVVVAVPQSERAPHQAQDGKYYQRLGRTLTHLKHRAIEDIRGRRIHPEIETKIVVHLGIKPFLFWKVTNVGRVIARQWMAVIKFPTHFSSSILFDDEKVTIDKNEDGEHFLILRVYQRMGLPLFPGVDISRSFPFHGVEWEGSVEPSIKSVVVTTYADEMPAKTETFALADVTKLHSA